MTTDRSRVSRPKPAGSKLLGIVIGLSMLSLVVAWDLVARLDAAGAQAQATVPSPTPEPSPTATRIATSTPWPTLGALFTPEPLAWPTTPATGAANSGADAANNPAVVAQPASFKPVQVQPVDMAPLPTLAPLPQPPAPPPPPPPPSSGGGSSHSSGGGGSSSSSGGS